MPATNDTINAILNLTFGSQAAVPIDPMPATMYIGLSTTLVDATGLASSTEPATADAYARVTFTNNDTNWSTSTAASLHNDVAITFTESTASWGTIQSIFIADSGTRAAGNILWYATLSPALVVGDNTVVSFGVGSVVVTIP
jgi:hypothetical protein